MIMKQRDHTKEFQQYIIDLLTKTDSEIEQERILKIKEKRKYYQKKWLEKNPEYNKVAGKKFREKNPDYMKNYPKRST